MLEQTPTGMVADVRDIPFPTGYFGAALISHVLEHLETAQDAVRAVSELRRVADHVEVVGPHRFSVAGMVAKGHRLWVLQSRGGNISIVDRATGESILL